MRGSTKRRTAWNTPPSKFRVCVCVCVRRSLMVAVCHRFSFPIFLACTPQLMPHTGAQCFGQVPWFPCQERYPRAVDARERLPRCVCHSKCVQRIVLFHSNRGNDETSRATFLPHCTVGASVQRALMCVTISPGKQTARDPRAADGGTPARWGL